MIFNYEPLVLEEDIESIVSCIRSGIGNPKHNQNVEKNLGKIFGIPCTLTSSGTAALHASLVSLGIGPGDEVLCSDLTFASSWNVIEYVGATPIFVDVKEDTWCMDEKDLLSKVTKKSKAVISVDLFGNSCDYISIKKVCDKFDLKLVQDSAESLGSKYMGKEIFYWGDVSCTSFNLNKIITSCGGGAVFCKDEGILDSIRNLSNQNKISSAYDYHGIGFNYRMGSISAALLISQAKRIERILDQKNKIKETYHQFLNSSSIDFQVDERDSSPNNWSIVCKFEDKSSRDNVFRRLSSLNIESKKIFKPGSMIEWISEKHGPTDCKVAKGLFERCLILPSSLGISKDIIEDICDIIKSSA